MSDDISIHAPRGGSDHSDQLRRDYWREFQSTLPAGGATEIYLQSVKEINISIHAPRGGSDLPLHGLLCRCSLISIHAPRGGSDKPCRYCQQNGYRFQSTLPAGGATATSANYPSKDN